MLTTIQEKTLIEKVLNIPELSGAGIAYYGKNMCSLLKNPLTANGNRLWVLITKDEIPRFILQKSSEADYKKKVDIFANAANVKWIDHSLNLVSCALTFGYGSTAVAATLAAPLTLGGSMAITWTTVALAAASAAQCGMGIGRFINDLTDLTNEPDESRLNDVLDSNKYINAISAALSVVTTGDALRGVGPKIMELKRIHDITKKPYQILFGSLSRIDKKLITKELQREIIENSGKSFNKLVKTGRVTKLYSADKISIEIKDKLVEIVAKTLDIYSGQKDIREKTPEIVEDVKLILLSE